VKDFLKEQCITLIIKNYILKKYNVNVNISQESSLSLILYLFYNVNFLNICNDIKLQVSITEFINNNNNNNNNNSYIFMTSIRSTHEKDLCYVCQVNKILWGIKSLAVYTTATRSRDDKTETLYQICSRWSHVREWVFLLL